MENKHFYSLKDKLIINGYLEFFFKKKESSDSIFIDDGTIYTLYENEGKKKSAVPISKNDALSILSLLNCVFKEDPPSVFLFENTRYLAKIDNKKHIILIWEENCEIQKINSIEKYIQKFKSIYKGQRNIYFRGQSFSHLWLPSLYRNREWIENEKNLNLRVMSRHVSEFFDCNTTIERLIKLKHYNMPSRLLDIVASPLMALYFACVSAKQNNEDAMVAVIFSDPKKEKFSLNSDTVTMLSNLSNIDLSSVLKSDIAHRENNLTSQLGYACQKEQKTDMYWSNIKIEDLDNCIVVNPELNNTRIIQQQGLFILCGFSFDNENSLPASYFDLFRNIEQKRIYYRFPNKKIDSLLADLDSFGINDSSVYFDLEKTIEFVKKKILKIINGGK